MIKYSFILIAIIGFGLSSCKKQNDCTFSVPVVTVPTAQLNELDVYMKSANPDAIKDKRGFYYSIKIPGEGKNLNPCSTISIFYKGTLTNGSIFDQTGANPATFGLNQLILGWQYGLPLIKPGGKIILYLPPELGYGSRAAGSIPPNSVLIFEVQLVSVG